MIILKIFERDGKYMKKAIDDNTVSSENQVTKNQSVYTLGKKDADVKIAILGNSITRHGPKHDIGWDHDFGMAASDIEHDYVHLLYKKLLKYGINCFIVVKQFATWERNFTCVLNDDISEIRDYQPDIIVFRLGENVNKSVNKEVFKAETEKLLYNIGNGKSKLLLTTCFWHHDAVDEVIREICFEKGLTPIELGDLGELPEMKAIGLFDHSGVAAHPGDLGMENIATRIFEGLKKLI